VLFKDGDEARRAQRGLQERGVPAADVRLYLAQEILRNEAHFLAGRSWLAKVVDALTADHQARRHYFANAQAGGAALWLYARPDTTPTGCCGSSPTTTSPPYGMTATRVSGR
jgi:hypothetical protein